MKFKSTFLLFAILLLASCKTPVNVVYFQDLENLNSGVLTDESVNYEAKIMPDDQLLIQVSAMNPAAVSMFNLPAVSYQRTGETSLASSPNLQTYLVDSKGDINFPVLGKIYVEGLTRIELSDILAEKISEYVKNPLVNVKINNFKVSVLGEVRAPGSKYFGNERITILDAISAAGDLDIYARRENVLILRDNNGKKEFHRIDLTSSDLTKSPYFYLQQNDVIYVEPNKARQSNSRFSQKTSYHMTIISTVISAVSVIASLTIALLIK